MLRKFFFLLIIMNTNNSIIFPQLTEYNKIAIFGGGCFLFIEATLEGLTGIQSVIPGYTGGNTTNPTYDQIQTGQTGHKVAVKVYYDPDLISYRQILNVYFRAIDPTDNKGNFKNKGYQYIPIIYYNGEDQKKEAEELIAILENSKYFDKKIIIDTQPIQKFYRAEDRYQDFFRKSSFEYSFHHIQTGRTDYMKKVWDTIPESLLLKEKIRKREYITDMILKEKFQNYQKPTDAELRQTLSVLSYEVTQESKTESAFQNEFYDENRRGIYVDIVSGEPLFSSIDKFNSGTGWPSFTKPIDPYFIIEKDDFLFFMKRIEIRSKFADSHLGHVFDDGHSMSGLRYCINSVALRFIPYEDMEAEGYESLLSRV